VDIFATNNKAIDLYEAEMRRRIGEMQKTIEDKEKAIREKDQVIRKYKDRDLMCAVIFLLGLFFMMIAVYFTINIALCI
jgi:hypothetical protein